MLQTRTALLCSVIPDDVSGYNRFVKRGKCGNRSAVDIGLACRSRPQHHSYPGVGTSEQTPESHAGFSADASTLHNSTKDNLESFDSLWATREEFVRMAWDPGPRSHSTKRLMASISWRAP